MKVHRPADFKGARPWDALDIAEIDNATVRLHWTDQPYKWHVNDGEEVFIVLDGVVEMRCRVDGEERTFRLSAGDIFHADAGDEHVARPFGEARVLVVERKGSV
jgi:mannose-6-phosphate isomerase-like protein (cupin superfamily)